MSLTGERRENKNLQLIRDFQSGNEDALEEFIEINMPAILRRVKNTSWFYNRSSHDKREIVEGAKIGLWKTMRDFRFDAGAKVSTFMVWKIRGEISHVRPGRTIVIPVKSKTSITEVSIESAKHLEFLAIDQDYQDIERKEAVSMVLAKLRSKDRHVLALRFGLDGKGERTLLQIANHYGVSKERARQITKNALSNARDAMELIGGVACV
jgi:RNA polymerase sigma factor (sigma-70 family)